MDTLRINGAEKEFPDGIPATVDDLLEQIGIDQATVVAEVDGQVVEREKFSQTHLKQGQSIELVRFVPGG